MGRRWGYKNSKSGGMITMHRTLQRRKWAGVGEGSRGSGALLLFYSWLIAVCFSRTSR